MPRRGSTIRWLLLTAMIATPALGGLAWWSRASRPIDLVAQAGAAYDHGDWEAAASLARERLKIAKDDPDAQRLLARAWFRLGRDDAASAIYARLGPTGLKAEDLCLLGRSLNRAGKTTSALKVWEDARGLAPDHAETLFELTRAYLGADRKDDAARTAGELARRPGWESRAEALLGAIQLERNQPADAVESWRRALDRPRPTILAEGVPSPIVPRTEFARALLRVGRPDEAREQLGLVLAAGPDEEAAWLLSRVSLQLRDWPAVRSRVEASGSFRQDRPIQPEPAPYIGSAGCVDCHADQARTQRASRHARTFSRASELGGFGIPTTPVPDPAVPAVRHAFRRDAEDRIHQETRTSGGVFEAVVQYAFGSGDRGVTMVGRDPKGRAYELRLSGYPETHGQGADARTDPHWDVTSGHPPTPDHADQYLGQPLTESSVRRCLGCHVTDPTSILEGKGPCAADRAIGCERCHGPGGHHLLAVEGKLVDLDPAIARPSMATAAQVVRLCSECHSPRGQEVRRDDPLAVRFQGTTLTWSRCYNESDGGLDCVTCHNPHRNASTSAAHYEARCLDCHSRDDGPKRPYDREESERRRSHRRLRLDTATRTTCPVNPTTGCIGCHMPTVGGVVPHSSFADHNIRVHRERTSETERAGVRPGRMGG